MRQRLSEFRPPRPREPKQTGGGKQRASGKNGPHNRRGWLWALAAIAGLLLINYLASQSALRSTARIEVPYRPTFVDQVNAGNVSEISSQGSKVQADLRHRVTYQGQSSAYIATVVPGFANLNQLSTALAREQLSDRREWLATHYQAMQVDQRAHQPGQLDPLG